MYTWTIIAEMVKGTCSVTLIDFFVNEVNQAATIGIKEYPEYLEEPSCLKNYVRGWCQETYRLLLSEADIYGITLPNSWNWYYIEKEISRLVEEFLKER